MTPRQHWEKAQLGLRAGATLDDIDDGLRHVRAIPKSAPEAVKAKALEKKLSRAENAASAQRLIDEAFTGDPSDSWVKFRRAGVHIDAMLKQNPNDRDAPRLLREAAQKGLGMLEREGRSHPQSMQAFMACQEETEKHLKAPATADFASYSRSAVQDHGSWRYTVASYVDAQNSFGAKIRTSFRCDVQCIEAGKCDASGASARAVDSLRKQAK